MDFRALAADGVELVGLTSSCDDGVVRFAPDLAANIALGDAKYLELLRAADAYVESNGLDLPEEPEAHVLGPDPECVTRPRLDLDLAEAGVTSIVWATGFAADYGWLEVDAFDERADRGSGEACPPSPASTSWACPGSPAEGRASSGASGTTPGTSPITSRPAAATSPTAAPTTEEQPMTSTSEGRQVKAPIVTGGHTRIRPFNTRDTYPEQNLDNDLCQAVVAGDTVYVRGQIGQDLDTSESVGIGDVEAQAERAMANITMLLEEAGSRIEHLVKLTIYLVDPRYREAVYRTVGRWTRVSTPSPPAWWCPPWPARSGCARSTPSP
ncbi:RidA family protein [Streptomyces sp. M19]